MAQPSLDLAFAALADPTRRALLARLQAGRASISHLADPFRMSLRGLLKHVAVLEGAGLVATRKQGRVRWVRLREGSLRDVLERLHGWPALLTEPFDARAAYIDLDNADVT